MPQVINSYSDWTLSDWLTHLENRYFDEIKLGLNRIKEVAANLQLLSPTSMVITVAGTNGKGTTVAALESIYKAAGYRVGTYTSPHLLRFNERIKINGECIGDDELCRAFCQIEKTRQDIEVTYFEMATLAALLHFQSSDLDVIVLEVGMGGRLDATNIIDADLSIITTIDFDHQDFLGNTLDQIAFEKAGILRVGKPFIYADKTPPQSILLSASVLGCQTYINGKHFSYQFGTASPIDVCHVERREGSPESQEIPLCARDDVEVVIFNFADLTFQFEKSHWHPNAIAAAIMATICLQQRLPIKENALIHGLQSISLWGRQQRLTTQVATLLDVSHNAQSVVYLADTVRKYQSHQRVHAVFSALCDKDIDALLQPMIGLVDHWYPALLTGKRALLAEQFDSILKKYGMMNEVFHNSPLDAYQVACQKAAPGDLIVVYGSFLTVSGVLSGLARQGLDK